MRIKQSTVLRLSFTIPFAVEVWRLRQSTQIRQMTCSNGDRDIRKEVILKKVIGLM